MCAKLGFDEADAISIISRLVIVDRRRNTDYSSTEIIVLLMLFLSAESIIRR
jgi:hypothetical protein